MSWRVWRFTPRGCHPLVFAGLFALVWLGACAGGDVRDADLVQPPGGPTAPGGDTAGTVQRGTLSVQVSIDPEDASIAQALGLPVAAPSGLTVTLSRSSGTTFAPRTATTDASGRVVFVQLLEGTYSLGVDRALSPAERAALPPSERDITAFAGGRTVAVPPGPSSTSVAAVASRRGSLVFSEVWDKLSQSAGGLRYNEGTFLELANNADTVIYLDGILFGRTPPIYYRTEPSVSSHKCEWYADIRLNDTYLTSSRLLQFPGTGRDYPLAPGAAVVIAQSAIDHTQFAPNTVDLSGADFEVIGSDADVNNPFVPDMRILHGSHAAGSEGRAQAFGFVNDVWFVALPPADKLDSIRVVRAIGDEVQWWPTVPSDLVLDVANISLGPESTALFLSLGLVYDDCEPRMPSRFDRAPFAAGGNFEFPPRLSIERRVAEVRPDGRVILQRTRTSARDFVRARGPSPGRLPP